LRLTPASSLFATALLRTAAALLETAAALAAAGGKSSACCAAASGESAAASTPSLRIHLANEAQHENARNEPRPDTTP
jgi:hypothetical protein